MSPRVTNSAATDDLVELVEHLLADLRRHRAERGHLLGERSRSRLRCRCLKTSADSSSPSSSMTIAAFRMPERRSVVNDGHVSAPASLIQLRSSLATFSGSFSVIALTRRVSTGSRRFSAACAVSCASSCASISLSSSATVRGRWTVDAGSASAGGA